jgi:fido (protein-threonine AMPylation protein)
MSNFDEYKKLGEPEKQEKADNWQTAIGLQQVDGLVPSEYLIETAKANIDGDITIAEVKSRLESYYKERPVKATDDAERIEEADKVSARIAEILAEKTFNFSPTEYIGIHKRLFNGIYKIAGKIRDYNITKDEWVLNGDTVYYASAVNLRETLEYDFSREKDFKFKGLAKQQIIEHIAFFISSLWQIHIFGEGNTRTTAVFLIKYLRTLGFKNVNNDLFAENSWYFRNSLVRANYEDLLSGINKTDEYLVHFLGNLLLGEKHILKNRELVIDTAKDTVKPQVDTVSDTVFTLIKANPKITADEIKDKLNIGIATAKRRIKALKDGRYIERVGSDKNGSWKVLKEQK